MNIIKIKKIIYNLHLILYLSIKYLKLCYTIIVLHKMNEDINKLKLEIEELKNKNNELEEKLKLYTNPLRNKKYYEKNSDVVKEKAKNYMEKIKKTNPDKLKEWRHNAYLNRKAKLKAQQGNINL